jgi:hypothetical protein
LSALPLLVPAPPSVAHKRARLVDAGGRVLFAALSAPVVYGTPSSAECPWCAHDAPDPECTCGFWGVADPWLLDDAVGPRRTGEAFLVVELSGSSVAYPLGARAAHQRVLGVGVDGWCSECLALGRMQCATRVARFAHGRGPFLWSVCARHARGALRVYNVDDLSLLLKMPVAFDWSQPPEIPGHERAVAAVAAHAPVALGVLLLVLAVVIGPLWPITSESVLRALLVGGITGAALLAMRTVLRGFALERLQNLAPGSGLVGVAVSSVLAAQVAITAAAITW